MRWTSSRVVHWMVPAALAALVLVVRATRSDAPTAPVAPARALATASDASTAEGNSTPLLSREQETGRLLFERYCAFCHGRAGDGLGINASNLPIQPADFTDVARIAARTDAQLFEVIGRGGRAGKPSPGCPPWGRRLISPEIESLVAYIRTFSRW